MSDDPSPAACCVVLTGRLKECEAFTEMLLWFADVPGRKCIYSIHNMVQVRQYSCGKYTQLMYKPHIRPYVCVPYTHLHSHSTQEAHRSDDPIIIWSIPWCLLLGWWFRWA